jgi:hypothetical protein
MALGLAMLLATGALAAAPRATRTSDGSTRLVLPPSVLMRDDVRRQLTNGLTTVFLVRGKSEAAEGRARVEIRYELWDERFLAAILDANGRRTASLPNFDGLVKWWEQSPLALRTPTGTFRAGTSLEVTVDVLPFSAREEADAEEWLSRSISKAQSASGLGKELPHAGSESGSNFFDLLIGTAIKRKPLLQFRWTIAVGEAR